MRPSSPTLTVLFAAAAGPRVGFGHLVRCGVLAAAMGVRPRVALRGSSATRREARALGWHVHRPMPAVLRAMSADLLVVDDPSSDFVAKWVSAAKAEGVPVVAVCDLGLDGANADLTIDGSLVGASRGAPGQLKGPDFAILDATIAELRREARPRRTDRVLIALGGGNHIRGVGLEVAGRVRGLLPDVEIELAPGFSASKPPALPAGCRWIGRHALRQSLATTTVAVVAGGVTLYEACALGTPMVTLAVTDQQRVTTAACAGRGAAVDASAIDRTEAVARAAADVAYLVATPDKAASLGTAARRLVDARGTSRVVAHIGALVAERRAERGRHAA